MGNIGTVCLILLFSMWITTYIGSNHQMGSGFEKFYTSITQNGFGGFLQFILDNMLVGGVLTIGSAITAYLISSSFAFTVRVFLLTGVASFLFSPFSGFMGEIGGCGTATLGCVPTEIVWLITGLFSMLMFIAVFSYSSGGDF